MKHSDSIAKLSVALVAAQAELRAIAKDSTNPHFKSRFASLDTIIADVRPILAKHGLAVVQGATTPESDANNHMTAITVETTLVHSSGEWLSSAVPIPLAKSDPQGAGGALTYGRRYSLAAALCLATEEDDDGNSASRGTGRAASAARTTGATEAARETRPASTAPTLPAIDQKTQLPFGKSMGTPIASMSVDALAKAANWARDNKPDKYAVFIEAAELEMDRKSAVGV